MSPTVATDIATCGWPHLVSHGASATAILANRLTTTPLWQIKTQGAVYALRGWTDVALARAEHALRFVRAVNDPPRVVVPVPVPIGADPSRVFCQSAGYWWELAPWLPGEANFAVQPSIDKVRSACRALAALHLRAARLHSEPAGSTVARHLAELWALQREIEQGRLVSGSLPPAVLNFWNPRRPSLHQALQLGTSLATQRLRSLAGVALPQHYVWGDAWHNNFQFVGDHVSGMVDFATVRIDAPVADLARLLGSMQMDGQDWWQVGIEAYGEVRPLGDVERRASAALMDSGTVLSLGNWLRWLGVEQRHFTNPRLAISRAEHFVARLARLLQREAE